MAASAPSSGAKEARGTASSALDVHAELSAQQATDGSVLLITVRVPKKSNPKNDEITGRFGETKFFFYPAPELGEDSYQAVIGVPHNHKPGSADVVVEVGGETKQLPVLILDGQYPSEVLKVGSRHVNPRKRDLIRIKKDQKEVGQIYNTITKEKYWNGPFVYPIDSPITSVYGTKRVFNGQMQSYHSGLDLRAAVGTPIQAAANGVVVLAKDLFFTGKTVMIDHGYGVVTLYAHMSRLEVKKGDRVEAKQRLGLSGVTGRVSGPHLHWGVVINKVKVNPLDALKVIR